MLIETLWWWCRYDSVTIDGKLTWQNQLNENNKPFFDLCDGILVNYSWEVFTSATYNLEILPFFPLNDFGKTFFFFFFLHGTGKFSKGVSYSCWRKKIWCLYGGWCIWEKQLRWWTVEGTIQYLIDANYTIMLLFQICCLLEMRFFLLALVYEFSWVYLHIERSNRKL